MIHKILRLFVNKYTVNHKDYRPSRDNLTQPIQIQLFQKLRIFLNFFLPFLKSILNFKHLPKKGDPHSRCVSGNTGCKKYGEINVQKALFQTTITQTTQQMDQKSLAISITASLQ